MVSNHESYKLEICFRWIQPWKILYEDVSLGETLNLDITRLKDINLSSKALTH